LAGDRLPDAAGLDHNDYLWFTAFKRARLHTMIS
jgi:hypothetical protein